jgi:hypothetical protein
MTALLISLPAFLGYVFGVCRWLQVSFAFSPLLCSCGLIILLFWAALAGWLPVATGALLGGGLLLFIIHLVQYRWWQEQLARGGVRNSAVVFFGGLSLILLCSLTGRPSVVDDYSFWAIIGKSIIAYQHLPGADTSIFARHLTYTPGLALFQYFFHSLSGQQDLFVAYVAQNLFLLTLLLALTEEQELSHSLSLIAAVFILLVFFSGSVLQKLRVDHFLYTIAFVVLWVQLQLRSTPSRFAVISFCLVCLYLIKEVGLIVAVFLLVVLVVDTIREKGATNTEKIRYLVGYAVVVLVLAMQKVVWDTHCAALGFQSFHSAVTTKKLIAAFSLIDNETSRHAFFIFLKECLIGAADGLKLPYLCWYLLLIFVVYKTLPRLAEDIRSGYRTFFTVAIPFYLLYAGMNYVMQYAVFGLGSTTDTPASLDRYLNIFFACFVQLILITGLNTVSSCRWYSRNGLIGLAVLIALATSWPTKKKPFDLEIEQLGKRMQPMLTADSRVCITPGNSGNPYPGFHLLYLQFPARFTVDPFPGHVESGRPVREKLAECDFLLVYRPEAAGNDLLQPFADQPLDHGSFFQVVVGKMPSDTITLEKRF